MAKAPQHTGGRIPQDVWPWLLPLTPTSQGGKISQYYGPPEEYGIDLAMPTGTPITSLTDGRVLDVGYPACPGGVVSIESVVQGSIASVYYQHMDQIVVTPGQQIHVGQLIGYSGGQLSGGHHPAERTCSGGPHIEVGINAPWGGVWHALGKNVNPLPWLQQLASASSVSVTANPTVGTLASAGRAFALTFAPGFLGVMQNAHTHEIFTPPEPMPQTLDPVSGISARIGIAGNFILDNVEAAMVRGLVISFGLLLIVAAIWSAFNHMIELEAEAHPAESQMVATAAGTAVRAGV